MQANIEAVRYIAEETKLVPVGMSIGPFSLMTKLLGDPITPVYLAGSGVSGQDEPEVRTVEMLLELAMAVIRRYMEAQIQAGARVFFIAEPAANKVYISPHQMAQGSDVFERLVLTNLRRLGEFLAEQQVSLFFHCCGELVEEMVRGFASLRPAVMSLGSSRKLWEDAKLADKKTVLYGNLPSKKFYSDEVMPLSEVRRQAQELRQKMQDTGHPFILGSECDVLSVPGCAEVIMAKALALAGR